MNDKHSVLLSGASGLVGQGILELLLREPRVARVTAVVRSALSQSSTKLRVLQVADYTTSSLEALDLTGHDACFYCAGPLPIGMSEASYRAATVEALETAVSLYSRANPNGYVIYISGLGADTASRLMPLRVKGDAEQVLRHAGIAFTAVRPGIISPVMGEQSPHALRRLLYALGTPLLTLGSRLAPSVFTTSRVLGACMINLMLAGAPYPSVVENRELQERVGVQPDTNSAIEQ